MDYGNAEIRDLAFRYIEEVCQNYDIDGVEMDFFRHPVFFRTTSRGEDATDEDRKQMTELLQRIRKMADEVGEKRGRPILISIKTSDSVEYARAIGLDIEKWMQDDLVDLYTPAGYFQLNEWKTSIDLGHKYGIKVYPSLDDCQVKDGSSPPMRMTDRAFRARANEAWKSGGDGIYLFNFNDYSPSKVVFLNDLGDPKSLENLNKQYFASYRGATKAAGGNLPYDKYQKIETLNPENPKNLPPNEPVVSKIQVFESVNPAETKPRIRLTLRLRFRTPIESKALAREVQREKTR